MVTARALKAFARATKTDKAPGSDFPGVTGVLRPGQVGSRMKLAGILWLLAGWGIPPRGVGWPDQIAAWVARMIDNRLIRSIARTEPDGQLGITRRATALGLSRAPPGCLP